MREFVKLSIGTLAVALIAGCAVQATESTGSSEELGAPHGDPVRGEDLFFNRNWGSQASALLPPEPVLLALQLASAPFPSSDPTILFLRARLEALGLRFDPYFTNYGWVRDPNNPAPIGLPIGMARASDGSIDMSCAACHAGADASGQLVPGMPNLQGNFGLFFSDVSRVLGVPVPPSFDAFLRSWGPGRVDIFTSQNEDGVNSANDTPVAWGRMNVRKAFKWGGEAETHEALMLATGHMITGVFMPEEDARDLTAYALSLAPPTAPGIDDAAAQRGLEVFNEAGCRSCHHGPDLAGSGRIVPLSDQDRFPSDEWPDGSIATDGLRLCVGRQSCGGAPNAYSELIGMRETDGYQVAPLTGVWTSPPYLHNGSVPTLRDLLEPASERPEAFVREGFLYDTTADVSQVGLGGNGNQGHEYGTDLTDAEKDDLVQYLRTL